MQHPVSRRNQEFLKCTHFMLFVNSYLPLLLYVWRLNIAMKKHPHQIFVDENNWYFYSAKIEAISYVCLWCIFISSTLFYICVPKLVKFGVSDYENHFVKTYNFLNNKQLLVIELLDECFFMGITVHSTWIQLMVRLL